MLLNSISLTKPAEEIPLNASQQGFAIATILLPTAGVILAMGLAYPSGLTNLDLSLFLSTYALTMIGVTVGLHRYFSHGAFQTNVMVKVMLAIFGSMAVQGSPLQWASNHRRHHHYSDQPGDVHSPHQAPTSGKVSAFWYSHIGWMFKDKVTNPVLFAKDVLRDPLLMKVSRLYLLWVVLGIAIPTLLEAFSTGTWMGALHGLLWGGLVRIFLVHHATWSLNSISHLYGDRPFRSNDQSTNHFGLALLNFGEGWHNNHHAFQSSAMFGLTWWQVDIGGWVIRCLEKLGLVWDVKVPSAAMQEAKRVTPKDSASQAESSQAQ